jgi:hypothetical protein
MKLIILWDVTPFIQVLAYTLTMKIEAVCSSEAPVKFYGTTECHIHEDRILFIDFCANFCQ